MRRDIGLNPCSFHRILGPVRRAGLITALCETRKGEQKCLNQT
jgi:hypothetical protein